jgi:cysteine-rich repeat protein
MAVVRYEVVICGDGIQHASEQCDDGNLVSGDGCDANCTPTACGNGLASAPETCDDGNTADGDCCSSTCQRDPAGTSCTADGNACTDDVCSAGGTCTHPDNSAPCDDGDGCTVGDVCSGGQCTATPVECPLCERCEPTLGACVDRPAATCLPVPFGAATRLQLADKADPKRDRVQWQRRKAFDTTPNELGDPIGSDDLALCLYDESGPVPSLRSRWRTRRGQCGSAPCWKALGSRGFRFRDTTLTPDGLDSVVLKGTAGSPSAFTIKGRGANVTPPTLPLPLPVRIQLQSTGGRCWEATYSPGGVQRNDDEQFKAVND